ncbi:MAG: universal stress protein [Rhodovibrionaceae bacterium]
MKNVLLPVDISKAQSWKKSIDTATEIAQREGATLHVLWVVPEIEWNLNKHPEDNEPELKKFIAETLPEGIEAKPVIRAGSAHREIRAAAEEVNADLIVLGSHDPKLTDDLIGSNAAKVALHSKCSVYVVR